MGKCRIVSDATNIEESGMTSLKIDIDRSRLTDEAIEEKDEGTCSK